MKRDLIVAGVIGSLLVAALLWKAFERPDLSELLAQAADVAAMRTADAIREGASPEELEALCSMGSSIHLARSRLREIEP